MKKTLRFAFIQTLPVLLGYSFIGIAFGLLLQRAGFGVLWAFFISLTVYAGSMQFVLVGILSGGMSLLSVIVMTLSINSRHIFYGLSFIERFKKMGGRRPYMIFSLTDETYSLLCSVKTPSELKEDDVFFAIALLNQLYWIIGSCAGSLLGELISFNSTGIEF
ncbi:MAG: AzlC family ABC transporter permease, partial [Oscillospiraceae bacterium]